MLTDAMVMASLPPRKRLAMQQQMDANSRALPRDAEVHSLKAEGDVPQQALTPVLLPMAPVVKKLRTALAGGAFAKAASAVVTTPEAAEAATRAAALRAKAQAAIQSAVAARQAAELAQRLAESATQQASAWAKKQQTEGARSPIHDEAAAAGPLSDEEMAQRLHSEINATATRRARGAAPTPPGVTARRPTAGPVGAVHPAGADGGMVGAHAAAVVQQQDIGLEGRSPSRSATESLSGDTTLAALGLECPAAAGHVPPPLAKVAAECDPEDGQPDTAKVLAHACAADGDHVSGDGHMEQHALAVAVVMAEGQR